LRSLATTRVLLLLALVSPIACRTRLASNLDGFVCDPGTGFCSLWQDGAASNADAGTERPSVDGSADELPDRGPPDGDARANEDAGDALGDVAGHDGGDAGGTGNVFISSPTGIVYTNGIVVIQVGFAPGSPVPGTVDILSSGSQTPLASIGSPFSFPWDTTNVPEGPYQITARAHFGANTVTSAPITVNVDRTPPTISTRVPLPNAVNVDLTIPIVVTVSEALAPATVTSSPVELSNAGSAVPSKTLLSADGKTLTITLSQRKSLSLPATLQELLPGTITDLAGNPLATTSWTWTAPLWLQYGSVQGGSPDLALDSKGNAVVCTVAERGAVGSGDFLVSIARHKADTTWDTSLGSPQGPQGSSFVVGASAVAIAADDNPIVAWPEFEGANTGNPSDIHVAKWTGTAWDTSFGQVNAEQGSGTNAAAPRLALAPSGQFFVAWSEASQTYVTSVYAARWTGTSWDQSYGGIAQIGATLSMLRVTAAGQPDVTWSSGLDGGGLSRWTGTVWASKVFPNSGQVGLDFDGMQSPLVTLTDTGTPDISVSRYATATDSISPAAPAIPTSTAPSSARVAVDGTGQILVAWTDSDGTTRNLHLARYDGTAWDTSFGTISAIDGPNTPAAHPALVITPDGVPVLAWDEVSAGAGQRPSTFVWKSNH
jgi:hypothetical protein